VLALAAAGCGGPKTPAEKVAGCLNDDRFLVQADGGRVRGSSPGGIVFTVVVATRRIDDRTNPGGRRLSPAERGAINGCLERR
jgi:hypothetical protein